jgi:pyruvate formate lyase activating enzyme
MTTNFGIKGFIKTSFIDWPGKICSVVFLGGCGFRCPACHNPKLVLEPGSLPDYPLDEVLGYLDLRGEWIDGVTITGGEPTVQRDLPQLLRVLRQMPVKIKLDTNGSHPVMLEALIESGLVDAVFMDVKAPLNAEHYARVAGVPADVTKIRRSIQVLKRSGLEITFRTTVVPDLVEEPELAAIRAELGDAHHFVIQAFRNVDTLDASISSRTEFDLARVESMRRRFEVPRLPAEPQQYVYAGSA